MNTDADHVHEEGMPTTEVWTCSMHPQIRQAEPGQCPICGMDLIPADTEGADVGLNEVKMTKNAMALANIQTMVVGSKTEVEDGVVTLSGKIKMNEDATAIQASYFDGRIEKLYVDFPGQVVRKGQLLATLYAPGLIAAQQELITAASLKETQPALYSAVRNKLKLWKLTEEQINAIESSGSVRENFPVYATVSGTVSEKLAAEGDYIKQGQPILKVSNLNTVWADFDAYESQISRFALGQDMKVASTAYPNREIPATISFIDPVLDSKTRTVTVRTTLNNADGSLKPGMFVKGKISGRIARTEKEIMIPATAVLWTGERSLVYVKTDPFEPVFEMREVTLGNRNGDFYGVVSGIGEGDEIVVNGTFTIDAAAQLQGKKSMMNDAGGTTTMGHDHGAMTGGSGKAHSLLTEASQSEAMTLLETYMKLKDALVKSDSEKVKEYAGMLQKNLSALMKVTAEDARSFMKKLENKLDALAGSSDLEGQRRHFVILSEQMIMIAMELEDKEQPVYVQYCPMANQDKGAQWLSWQREIRNPYYGDAMLTCGEVRREL